MLRRVNTIGHKFLDISNACERRGGETSLCDLSRVDIEKDTIGLPCMVRCSEKMRKALALY